MGMMQETLASLLDGLRTCGGASLSVPRSRDIVHAGLEPQVAEMYRALGGILDPFVLNLRSWDIEFDGAAVELDEHLHFNRYRLLTLQSPLYARLTRFPMAPYRDYCKIHEGDCLTAGSYGGKWTNLSSERQFGRAGTPKDLDGNGAPRWKQRAFYDFVKDLSPLVIGVTVVRVSMWDTIADGQDMRLVKDVLLSPSPYSSWGLAALIRSRKS